MTRLKLSQVRTLVREMMIAEARHTFGLRVGDAVRHRDEPERGLGNVVAKGHKRDRIVLVRWEDGNTQRHDPSALISI